jgi:hypothetical protein
MGREENRCMFVGEGDFEKDCTVTGMEDFQKG